MVDIVMATTSISNLQLPSTEELALGGGTSDVSDTEYAYANQIHAVEDACMTGFSDPDEQDMYKRASSCSEEEDDDEDEEEQSEGEEKIDDQISDHSNDTLNEDPDCLSPSSANPLRRSSTVGGTGRFTRDRYHRPSSISSIASVTSIASMASTFSMNTEAIMQDMEQLNDELSDKVDSNLLTNRLEQRRHRERKPLPQPPLPNAKSAEMTRRLSAAPIKLSLELAGKGEAALVRDIGKNQARLMRRSTTAGYEPRRIPPRTVSRQNDGPLPFSRQYGLTRSSSLVAHQEIVSQESATKANSTIIVESEQVEIVIENEMMDDGTTTTTTTAMNDMEEKKSVSDSMILASTVEDVTINVEEVKQASETTAATETAATMNVVSYVGDLMSRGFGRFRSFSMNTGAVAPSTDMTTSTTTTTSMTDEKINDDNVYSPDDDSIMVLSESDSLDEDDGYYRSATKPRTVSLFEWTPDRDDNEVDRLAVLSGRHTTRRRRRRRRQHHLHGVDGPSYSGVECGNDDVNDDDDDDDDDDARSIKSIRSMRPRRKSNLRRARPPVTPLPMPSSSMPTVTRLHPRHPSISSITSSSDQLSDTDTDIDHSGGDPSSTSEIESPEPVELNSRTPMNLPGNRTSGEIDTIIHSPDGLKQHAFVVPHAPHKPSALRSSETTVNLDGSNNNAAIISTESLDESDQADQSQTSEEKANQLLLEQLERQNNQLTSDPKAAVKLKTATLTTNNSGATSLTLRRLASGTDLRVPKRKSSMISAPLAMVGAVIRRTSSALPLAPINTNINQQTISKSASTVTTPTSAIKLPSSPLASPNSLNASMQRKVSVKRMIDPFCADPSELNFHSIDDNTSDAESALFSTPGLPDAAFWRAVTRSYPLVARRTPHLLASRLRQGVPSLLRGRVWRALTRSAATHLAPVYPKLLAERSPFDKIIVRDLARTFPGVAMFREAGGKGQRALGRLLRAYAIYDAEVGYCQGLGFLAGPLLMNMPEVDAFCTFVRLLDSFNLRTMFTPTMSGLHLRLHQLTRLIEMHLPVIHAHFMEHAIPTPLFASQWFLTIFAYNYPLPFVLRVWDVAMAEGVAETVLRVGLALLERNHRRLMRCNDFESLVRMLTRGLWHMEPTPTTTPTSATTSATNSAVKEENAAGTADTAKDEAEEEAALLRQVNEVIVEAVSWGKVVTPETLETLKEEWERDYLTTTIPTSTASSGRSR